jgi:hypothetical protein
MTEAASQPIKRALFHLGQQNTTEYHQHPSITSMGWYRDLFAALLCLQKRFNSTTSLLYNAPALSRISKGSHFRTPIPKKSRMYKSTRWPKNRAQDDPVERQSPPPRSKSERQCHSITQTTKYEIENSNLLRRLVFDGRL